ncbi:helix-turn-helix transcriptional regulator [Pseudoalteromonas sp. S2755]|uniref:helix-turn-helix domain-containing protein n=1 Tax=Pseudoalteromonas sp. S2755 TaxID=2066523 RepID=UPI00110A15EB|nr:helix-turn-helix transcriptional regulator [Pseudoalteromonas sp. S2755]TMN38831.1 hypothetical protein CWC03_10815 [Pseudoalteromonas sp. S2755]
MKANWARAASALMRIKGVKQKDLVSLFGVKTQGGVSHYFNGRYSITDEQLRKLAIFLGVDENYFTIVNLSDTSSVLDTDILEESLLILSRFAGIDDEQKKLFFSIFNQLTGERLVEVYGSLLQAKVQKEELLLATAVKLTTPLQSNS